MIAKKSILSNRFIADLENELLTNPSAKTLLYDAFKNQLWDFLCVLDELHFRKLSKQLNIKYRKGNIGNVQYKILELLKLDY